MELFARLVAALTVALDWVTFSSVKAPLGQQLLLPTFDHNAALVSHASTGNGDGPVFKVPAGGPMASQFQCDYTAMGLDWQSCSTAASRGCWLRHKNGTEFNIHTDYEKSWPFGVDRFYKLETNDGSWNADGVNFVNAKLFNNTYPGPLIQACWGDRVHIEITNKMKYNGTSIHWHGIRQLNNMHMDGVNGITQCPIAPGDRFTYVFNTTQYGSTWYHSHYSVQYADGLQGPIIVHGPKSANYDEDIDPLIMTDWGHNTAFQALLSSVDQPSLLLNGKGNITRFNGDPPELGFDIPLPYELDFDAKNVTLVDVDDINVPGRPKRYLLRLINTSFDSTFVFSIDNHWLQVISSDFVPIHPYLTTSVLVGIGQRYNVIVEAMPKTTQPNGAPAPTPPSDGNFWMRNWVANNCGLPGGRRNYERVGIVRYNSESKSDPTSNPWYVPKRCSDEPYGNLKPIVPWQVSYPANGIELFGVVLRQNFSTTPSPIRLFPTAFFSLQPNKSNTFVPLQVQYSDPTFLHLGNAINESWPESLVVTPEGSLGNDNSWVWFVLAGDKTTNQTTGAHPIHLHGHDFAVLQQEEELVFTIENFRPKLDNPPRRDVVLLPRNGFVIIAFKTDNPGSWLMHCHIARHAAEGLALQVLERREDADRIWPRGSLQIKEAERVCKNWKNWYGDCNNYWPGVKKVSGINPGCHDWELPFQEDSGI